MNINFTANQLTDPGPSWNSKYTFWSSWKPRKENYWDFWRIPWKQ